MELPSNWKVKGKDLDPDFTVTEIDTDNGTFSLYVGFHPLIEKKGDNIKKLDVVSRYERPFLIIHEEYEGKVFLEVLMILESEEYGKTCFLHLRAPKKRFKDKFIYINFLRSVDYKPSDCPKRLGGDIAEPVGGGNATR